MEIWKYPFEVDDIVKIEMPFSAQILSVQYQNGTPCFWALVDTENSRDTMTFRIFGTGHPIKGWLDDLVYIGTIQHPAVNLVWHIFEDVG